MSDALDDQMWAKVAPGVFCFDKHRGRFGFGWTDTRVSFGLTTDPLKGHTAAIQCTGPGVWKVWVRGDHIGTTESWDEAKSLASLLINVKETE